MKNLKYIVVLAVLAFLGSCEDATDIIQPGTLDANRAYSNVEDLELGRLGLYRLLDTSDEIAFTSRFTDETRLGFDNGGQARALYTFNLNSESVNPSSMWASQYRIIREATQLINAASALDVDPADQPLVDNIKGQASAIRAFAHFSLLSFFSTDLTDDSALGVPAVDFIAGADVQPRRDTNADVFALIDSDLAEATSSITGSDPTFFTVDGVNAFKARMAAYRGQYNIAAPLAQQLLTAYPLADQTNYDLMFQDVSNDEIIFKLERTVNDIYDGQGTGDTGGGTLGSLFAFTGPDLNGSPYMEMAKELADLHVAGDIRTTVNLITYPTGAVVNDRDVHIVDKYEGSESRPLMNDIKVFRSSEMLFILAEARVDQGLLNGAGSASELIGQLRTARFGAVQSAPNFTSAADAYGQILDERRIELAFEGHRYKDLRRLGAQGNRTISRDNIDCAQLGTCSLPITDFRFTFPIPLNEIIGNPGIADEQNPGY